MQPAAATIRHLGPLIGIKKKGEKVRNDGLNKISSPTSLFLFFKWQFLRRKNKESIQHRYLKAMLSAKPAIVLAHHTYNISIAWQS